MRRHLRYYRIFLFKYDLPAGLTVFLVALPICLGISLASGAPIYAGIVSGIIGGIVVSLISRSPLSVSGPAAGLSTVVAASIISLGDYRVFLLTVLIAGGFQVLFGILKFGNIANFFPSAVIKGMLAAIGILLILNQIPVALGYDSPDFWSSSLVGLSRGNLADTFRQINNHSSMGAIMITVVSVLIMILFQKPSLKKYKFIPGALVVVIVAVLINLLFLRVASVYSLKPTQMVNIPADIFSSISFPDFSKIFSTLAIWKDGLIIALLASLETLLCVEAIDKLDVHNRVTPVNRELLAQGAGNIACGLLGAIPITAVIIRGSANVDAGARTRISAFVHGVCLLLAVLFIPFLLNRIPYAALAAILIITGYNLTKPKLYRSMWKLGREQFLPFILTIVMILFTDLLIGVTAGLLFSAYFIIQNNFKSEIRVVRLPGSGEWYIKLSTNVTFLNKVQLKEILEDIPDDSTLIIDGTESSFVDYDILEMISEYDNKARDRNITLQLRGIEKVNISAIH